MRVFSRDQRFPELNETSVEEYGNNLTIKLSLNTRRFYLPLQAPKQLALARVLEYIIFRSPFVCMMITDWGIYNDHMELFYDFRKSNGESRLLIEAPVHVFDDTQRLSLVSLIILSLYFNWDGFLCDLSGEALVRFSHDGWIELRCASDDLAQELGKEIGNIVNSMDSQTGGAKAIS